jgi:hypothetical protein
VISTSFADIFYNNCFKNGILPIVVSPEDLEKLFDDADRGSNATLTVDLEKQEIKGPDGGTVTFDIDPFRKHCLMNGLDDIGLTMEKVIIEKHAAPEGDHLALLIRFCHCKARRERLRGGQLDRIGHKIQHLPGFPGFHGGGCRETIRLRPPCRGNGHHAGSGGHGNGDD